MTKLPPDAVLRKLMQLGATDDELARSYGVTPQAVWKRRSGLGMLKKPIATRVHAALKEAWDVKSTSVPGRQSHHNKRPLQALKYYMRQRLGDETLSPTQLKQIGQFLENVSSGRFVIEYRRDTEAGFFYVPREARDEDLLVRWPEGVPLPGADIVEAMRLPPVDSKAPQE
ncbi:hypothetical protein ACH427_03260 [Streptomyces sp. NPDC020379]|uniref:hypothetical protein n=1 Tax=Streptomyces sp. NPDC020379 TaxID=3365071 RepID=UPI0037A03966